MDVDAGEAHGGFVAADGVGVASQAGAERTAWAARYSPIMIHTGIGRLSQVLGPRYGTVPRSRRWAAPGIDQGPAPGHAHHAEGHDEGRQSAPADERAVHGSAAEAPASDPLPPAARTNPRSSEASTTSASTDPTERSMPADNDGHPDRDDGEKDGSLLRHVSQIGGGEEVRRGKGKQQTEHHQPGQRSPIPFEKAGYPAQKPNHITHPHDQSISIARSNPLLIILPSFAKTLIADTRETAG